MISGFAPNAIMFVNANYYTYYILEILKTYLPQQNST